MARYLASRIGQALFTLWLLVTGTFFLNRVIGDPVALLLPQTAGSAERAALRHELGLDRPIILQYLQYLSSLGHLDLGQSYISGVSVRELVGQRLVYTLELTLAAAVLAIGLAVPLGVLAALRRGEWVDRLLLGLAVLGQATPSFLLGIILILVFAVWLRWLPVAGVGTPQSIVLPAIALGSFMIAGLFRLIRSSMLEVLDSDFVKFARIKGVSEPRVIFVHALRNALLGPITFTAIYLGLLIGGTVVVETVFNWPGIGSLAYDATLSRDFPVIQAVVLVASAGVLICNLAADLLYGVVDPRVRH